MYGQEFVTRRNSDTRQMPIRRSEFLLIVGKVDEQSGVNDKESKKTDIDLTGVFAKVDEQSDVNGVESKDNDVDLTDVFAGTVHL